MLLVGYTAISLSQLNTGDACISRTNCWHLVLRVAVKVLLAASSDCLYMGQLKLCYGILSFVAHAVLIRTVTVLFFIHKEYCAAA